MLKDMQYIIQAVEDRLAAGEYYRGEVERAAEKLAQCEEALKKLNETIKVKEAQLEDAEKRIGELEEALRRLKDGGVKRC